MGLTKAVLNQLSCAQCKAQGRNEDCASYALHAKCHVDALMEVWYVKELGQIIVKCGECEEEVTRIEVGD